MLQQTIEMINVKDEFYEQLQAALQNTPRHDMKIVMGDLNAKDGSDNADHDKAMGREGCHMMNENGERLVELCSTYDLVIGGTLFPHTDIHKLTWYCPNGRDRSQIDFLMINGTWTCLLLDVKVKQGTDLGSNHHLILAVLKVKLRKTGNKKTGRQQFVTEKLHDPKVKGFFLLQLRNRFQGLADMDDHTEPNANEINTMWEQIKTAYMKTSETCLGFKQKRKKGWITVDTWQMIENRRTLKKQKMRQSPKGCKKDTRCSTKKQTKQLREKPEMTNGHTWKILLIKQKMQLGKGSKGKSTRSPR